MTVIETTSLLEVSFFTALRAKWLYNRDMTAHATEKIVKYLKYAIITLIVVLVLLGALFVWNYLSLMHARLINMRELQLSALVHDHGPLTANDVGLIRPWMTFDYINALFKVPPDYLKANMSIMDTSYPRLSLSGYAKYQGTSTTAVLGVVENSLTAYLTSHASSAVASTTTSNATK